MRVRLERMKNGVALRTSEVLGETDNLPHVGERFLMTAPPLDPAAGNMRMVFTSPVRMVFTSLVVAITPDYDEYQIVFQTENSTYRLTRLKDRS